MLGRSSGSQYCHAVPPSLNYQACALQASIAMLAIQSTQPNALNNLVDLTGLNYRASPLDFNCKTGPSDLNCFASHLGLDPGLNCQANPLCGFHFHPLVAEIFHFYYIFWGYSCSPCQLCKKCFKQNLRQPFENSKMIVSQLM